jgi:hypothetical protein
MRRKHWIVSAALAALGVGRPRVMFTVRSPDGHRSVAPGS